MIFVMLFWYRCHIIVMLYWHKLVFKKCTKTQCFCIVFEDRPFWLQHQIILKLCCKRHGKKLSFSASCGHGFFIEFSMILGSFWGPKSMKNEMRKGTGNEIGKKWVPDRTRTAPRGFKTRQDAPRPRSWSQLGPKRGPKIDLKSIKIRSCEPPRPKTPPRPPQDTKMDPKMGSKSLRNQLRNPFKIHSTPMRNALANSSWGM